MLSTLVYLAKTHHYLCMTQTYPPPLSHAKSGFTLIELSVVLAIFGILMGSIVIGKEMIEAAQVRKTVTQFQQLDTAVLTFKQKYNCLPGDCLNPQARFGFVAPSTWSYTAGSVNFGNNVLDTIGVGGEPYITFGHLVQAGLLESDTIPLTVPNHLYDKSLRVSGIYPPENNWWIYDSAIWKSSVDPFQPVQDFPQHFFALVASLTHGWANWVIRASTAYAIDSKMDDGLPGSGIVRAFGGNWGTANSNWGLWNSTSMWGSQCLTSYHTTNPPMRYNISAASFSGDGFSCGLAVRANF